MSTPYQLLSADARNEVTRRKSFYERKLQECENILRMLDVLPTFFRDHPVPPDDAPVTSREHDGVMEDVDLPAVHRPKEELYDEEMRRLLSQVTVASRQAVFQHFYRVFRGNTSVGAVESYLKRAALRGVIVRPKRGEYRLPPQAD